MNTTPSPLALSIALHLKDLWSIGTSSSYCGEQCWDSASPDEVATAIDTILLPRLVAQADKLEAAIEPPPEICGLCGGPILPDDDAKVPHPAHWPGERRPDTDIVHVSCEQDECGRAHAALTDAQRAAFLKSL